MIQELLGGTNSGFIAGERKMFSVNGSGGILEATTVPHHSSLLSPSPSPSPSPSSSSSTSTASAATAAAASASSNSNGNSAAENLRCPRCDSANTKFCYYNNYNLTQPRHFCKTCRRYWTKGGALRNVPIGGGCRKNKSPTAAAASAAVSSSAAVVKSIAGKMKIAEVAAAARPGFGIGGAAGFDPHADIHLSPSPILWGSPQNSHLLALLRSAHHQHPQNPNPNPNSLCSGATSLNVKEEGVSIGGSHMVMSCSNSSSSSTSGAESTVLPSNGTVNLGRSLGLDPMGQVPSLGLCSSFRRSSPNNNAIQNQQPPSVQYQQSGFTLVDHQSNGNSGIQELYQRLRSSSSASSSGNYYNDQTAVVLTPHHVGSSSSSSSSSILESAPVHGGAGETLGFWNNNSAFSWSDLPTTTTHSAYP